MQSVRSTDAHQAQHPGEAVQLIGQWGSAAVKRYIQDAPLSCNFSPGPSSRTVATRATAEKAIPNMVKRYLDSVSRKFWIKSPTANVIHIPATPEFSMENSHWRTLCGWPYGTAAHTHTLLRDPRGQPVSTLHPYPGIPGSRR